MKWNCISTDHCVTVTLSDTANAQLHTNAAVSSVDLTWASHLAHMRWETRTYSKWFLWRVLMADLDQAGVGYHLFWVHDVHMWFFHCYVPDACHVKSINVLPPCSNIELFVFLINSSTKAQTILYTSM